MTTDVQAVRRRHEDRLLSLPNVTGVGTGPDPRTGASALVVYVTRKVPRAHLRPEDAVPETLDGIPVHVVEIGEVRAQPS